MYSNGFLCTLMAVAIILVSGATALARQHPTGADPRATQAAAAKQSPPMLGGIVVAGVCPYLLECQASCTRSYNACRKKYQYQPAEGPGCRPVAQCVQLCSGARCQQWQQQQRTRFKNPTLPALKGKPGERFRGSGPPEPVQDN